MVRVWIYNSFTHSGGSQSLDFVRETFIGMADQFEGTLGPRRNSPSNRAFSIAMTRLCGEILQ
jgi:hypothetical protein